VLVAQRRTEHGVQVGTVQVVHGRTPALDRGVSQRHAGEQGTALAIARVHRERDDADRAERRSQAKLVQERDDIGAKRDAGSHFAQDARLFIDVGIEPSLAQGDGGAREFRSFVAYFTRMAPASAPIGLVVLPRPPGRELLTIVWASNLVGIGFNLA